MASGRSTVQVRINDAYDLRLQRHPNHAGVSSSLREGILPRKHSDGCKVRPLMFADSFLEENLPGQALETVRSRNVSSAAELRLQSKGARLGRLILVVTCPEIRKGLHWIPIILARVTAPFREAKSRPA